MKFICIILLLLSNLIYAKKIVENDSLKKYSFLDLKVKFDNYYYRDKIHESKLIATYFLQKAKNEKNENQIAEGYMLMQFDESFTNALKYIDSVKIYSTKLDKRVYPAKIYLLRGNLYFKFDYIRQALDNYILALRYARENKNERQIAFTELNIAFLQNYIGKYKEAAKTFRYYLYNGKSLYNIERSQIQQNLADAYIALEKLDSAKVLIQEGIQSSLENKDKYNYYKYLSLSGFYDVKKKNYKKAVSDLQLCKIYFSADPSDLNINYTLFVLGKAYIGLHETDRAVQTFVKIDSNIQKTNNNFPELREIYTYLIDYYKKKNDKEKQLYYIDRFLKVDRKLDEQFKYLATELPKKYDTPNLLQEKENIINDLKNRKKIMYLSIGILLLILLSVLYLYYKAKNTAKKHRKIAQELIETFEQRSSHFATQTEKEIPELQTAEQTRETESKVITSVSDEVIQYILKELEAFESKQLFLKNGITLASLAKNIKTNTAYLSEVINSHKGKNFNSYLNDLRIDYVLERLVKDKKFRSYKLPAIAEEIGYNNVQAFSAAFKKKTETTPSIYIKEIENSITY